MDVNEVVLAALGASVLTGARQSIANATGTLLTSSASRTWAVITRRHALTFHHLSIAYNKRMGGYFLTADVENLGDKDVSLAGLELSVEVRRFMWRRNSHETTMRVNTKQLASSKRPKSLPSKMTSPLSAAIKQDQQEYFEGQLPRDRNHLLLVRVSIRSMGKMQFSKDKKLKATSAWFPCRRATRQEWWLRSRWRRPTVMFRSRGRLDPEAQSPTSPDSSRVEMTRGF